MLPYRECLQYQRHCLWNRNEVPGHLGMRNGDATPGANLLLKDRYDAALRAQHVPKTDREAAHPRWLARADNHLAQPFRATHHAAGLDRFVR